LFSADFNGDGQITTFDVVIVNQIINLGNTYVPPAGTFPWRFFDKTQYDAMPAGQITPIAEGVFNRTVPNSTLTQNFVAIKRGNVSINPDEFEDIDNICTNCNTLQGDSDERNISVSTPAINTFTTPVFKNAGSRVRIPISVKDFNSVTSFTMGIALDPRFLTLESLELADLPIDMGDLYADLELNTAKFSWTGAKFGGYTLSESDVLFYINAYVERNTDVQDVLSISSFENSALDGDWKSAHFEWNSKTDEPKVTLSATPNPFNQEVNISYYLPQSGEVSLRISDATGREVSSAQFDADMGWYNWQPNMSNQPSGYYICRLEMNNEVITTKLIKN
jgi:Secretion system C-terminal sorting domain